MKPTRLFQHLISPSAPFNNKAVSRKYSAIYGFFAFWQVGYVYHCLSKNYLITIETQLCNSELFRVDYMGRHKPIPGGSAAAVQAADAHIINTKQLLLRRVG